MPDKQNKLSVPLKKTAPIVIGLILAFALGMVVSDAIRNAGFGKDTSDAHAHEQAEEAKDIIWTCSMHPQIRMEEKGLCPICNMDLIPLDTGDGAGLGEGQLSVSENAAQLMNVETAPVERRFVSTSVRMVGKVDYDHH